MKKRRNMTCEEFTARMPQLVAAGEDIFAHSHVRSCRVHRALLQDLEAIAQAAQQLFPDVDPSDKVWARIKDEIGPAHGKDEWVSDPFPGFRLVIRVRVNENRKVQDNPMAYDDQTGGRNAPVPGMRIKAAGRKSPPHLREGR
jgi:hypothetical protein